MVRLRILFRRLGVLALLQCYFILLSSAHFTHPTEVGALLAVSQKLKDSQKNLVGWKKDDPCVSKWKGVICTTSVLDDGRLHVIELRLLSLNLSGTLAPELGELLYAERLNFMWNNISGSIPKEIGKMTSLQLLLLSGNQISGPLPDELGNLPNLTKFQLDLNQLSGPLPRSFANLTNAKHFHMNNNSFSGQIPPELSALPNLIHFLLDNNNLSGYLPPELSKMPKLTILQLNNNNFDGTEIPDSYANMSNLLKLSLRNCNLQGAVPDFSRIKGLHYLDLSSNMLTGSIPANKLSDNITTINLSNNMLNGSIPSYMSQLPRLQKLLLKTNMLTGDVPSNITGKVTNGGGGRLILDFQNNFLSNISGILSPPANVSIKLQGNTVCRRANELNIVQFCGSVGQTEDSEPPGSESSDESPLDCPAQSCPISNNYEYVPDAPSSSCFCAAPLGIGLRLRSPAVSDFRPYRLLFEVWLTSNLDLDLYQLVIDSFVWEEGPRLRMFLKLFPTYSNISHEFNSTVLQHLMDHFATFSLPGDDNFGPYDLLNFTLLGPYENVVIQLPESGMSRAALVGIVLGAISFVLAISLVIIAALFYKKRIRFHLPVSKIQSISKFPIITGSVKEFSFLELEMSTNGFNIATQVGRGGYGKVYKGILADGRAVAVKRALEGSLQGQKEFFTEIELLSRLHHRNLVSLVGYCNEEGEQMLVYEFMPNGSLGNLLSGKFVRAASFSMRMNIALGSAKGVLYLHTEADPPIIHRDIKANNILLDFKFNAKVSDFGLSRPAAVQDSSEGVAPHVTTIVKGTPGYVDPEYFLTNKLTEKSDVYSLGVVFLELLTGMAPISHGRYIVREAKAACQCGQMFSIIDKNMGPYPSDCIKKFMALALNCCQDELEQRPTMLEVVRELENISSMMQESLPVSSQFESSSSSSGMSRVLDLPSLCTAVGKQLDSTEFFGSDLVSGVIPPIKPR